MKNIIVIARSARMLATSAYHLGYSVHVLDCFVDEDTKAVSSSSFKLQYNSNGFDEVELCTQVQNIIASHSDAIIVTGTGFEKQSKLLKSLAALAPLLSNSEQVVRKVKEPASFYTILKRSFVKAPEFSITRPVNPKGWLIKMRGGVGGAHVQWLVDNDNAVANSDYYYQKYCAGTTRSAVFLASDKEVKIVGFNVQLQTNTFSNMPFLYKGAISSNELPAEHKAELLEIVSNITSNAGLKGLCGIDYIITDTSEIVVLEINPRPPASYGLHEQCGDLFAGHIACFTNGNVEHVLKETNKFRGYEIYYASKDLNISNEIEWPGWTKDIPCHGTNVIKGFPVCSVHAEGDTIEEVKVLLNKKIKIIRKNIHTKQSTAYAT